MDLEWKAILNRFGQQVLVYNEGQKQGCIPTRAILQPAPVKGEAQLVPGPLGLERKDRLFYLGPSGVGLTPRHTFVEWNGQTYEVEEARAVLTDKLHHWWGILCPTERVLC